MVTPRLVSVLDLLTDKVGPRGAERTFLNHIGRQYYSIMPQVVATWCRRRGHRVHYATYFGQADPESLVDPESDIVFVSAYTRASSLAYALAKLLKQGGARTVIGGPHANCFPEDAARFFDHVVVSCGEEEVIDLVEDRIAPGQIVTTGKKTISVPTLGERLEDVKTANYVNGKRSRLSTVSLLTSTGCPYTCSFCSDWNSVYASRSTEEVAADLKTVAEAYPGNLVAFHDPNFGVRFDQTLAAFEALPKDKRNPYIIESSLSLLRSDRIDRLRDTNCSYLAPGIESWYLYGDKAKTSASVGRSKFERVCDKFDELTEKIPSLQANFLIGDDGDAGDEPFELTKRFIDRYPTVFPVINLPMAFGGTPLRDSLAAEGRLLPLPPIHYASPVLTHRPVHYSMRELIARKIDLFNFILAPRLFARRMRQPSPLAARIFWALFCFRLTSYRRELRQMLRLFDEDRAFIAFHEGQSETVPAYYDERIDRRLKRYGSLLTAADRRLVPGDGFIADAARQVSPPAA